MDKLAMYDKEAFIKSLQRQGIRNQAVLDAMATVPREEFVGIHLQEFAYDNSPLPIEEGQTISQPYIVAFMTEALELDLDSRVLEVGTGSGYAAAILSHLSKEVYTIERHQSLAHLATSRLEKLNYNNVHVLYGDGTLGWPEHAPLGQLWIDPPGYFCRQSGWVKMKFAFTNYGISLGLQSLDHWPNRVQKLNTFFDNYVSNDEYDTDAITHVMACTSHYPGLFLKPST